MMGRYIDLDKCGQYRTNHGGYPDTFAFPPWAEFEDVAPVVHAHWERKRMLTHDGELYCSNCEWTPEVIAVGGTTVHDLQLADVYYCPHCGAKMDEE